MDHEQLAEALQYLDDGADLAHYAAHAAAMQLVQSWTAADTVYAYDIDDVISALQAFKKRITARP